MTAPDHLSFRDATDDDWPAIWPVFRAVVAEGDTYVYPPDIDEMTARRSWMIQGSRRRTFVAVLDGRIVGTAQLQPAKSGLGDHVANAGWMIDPGAAGRGIGRRFAHHVLEEAASSGFTAMQFNAVVATNTRALALWESLGFHIVGSVPDAFRHRTEGLTDLHVMYRVLGAEG